jgi:FkbM family methyltransferase
MTLEPKAFPAIMWQFVDWEPNVSRLLKQVRGDVFIDVGCNVGYFVHLLKNNFRQIIGFEADPEIAREARKHAPPNATIYHLAISDRDGFTYVRRNPLYLHSGSSMVPGEDSAALKVPCGRLSGYIPRDCVVDLVKVDVEGAEWLVLKGAEPVMHQVRHWMVELHDLDREKELDCYLRERYGYNTQWLKNGASLPHVFARRGG